VFEHVHLFLQLPLNLFSHALEDYKPGRRGSDLRPRTSDLRPQDWGTSGLADARGSKV